MKRALALCLGLATGCGLSDGSSSNELGTPENPIPNEDAPYQVITRVELTAELVLPPQANLVVVTLRELSKNPGHALIAVAQEAGVPAVGTLYALLPDALEASLEGWINEEIAKVRIQGKPVTEYAGQLAALAETALTQLEIASELNFHARTATHHITALDLTPTGLPLRLPISGAVGELLAAEPGVTIGKAGALSFGEQRFGLHYGEYAWQAIESVSQSLFGAGIRETLGKAIDCPGLAQVVATRCLLGVCVGHQAELTSICEGGLDATVDFAHDRMAALALDAFHLDSGQATLVDEDGDGVADRITDGTWKAQLDLGLGAHPIPASFTGFR